MERTALQALARLRWRMAIGLSALMVLIYFGFILLIAFLALVTVQAIRQRAR